MERIRAFVALNLPVEVIDRMAELQRQLREAASAAGVKARWVPPPNLHLTLKFLGSIPSESVAAIRDVLAPLLAERAAPKLALHGLGVFPDPARPRVLWAGIDEEDGAVTALAGEVDSQLAEIGFEPEKRPFHPHLTLGRIKQGNDDFWSDLAPVERLECRAVDVTLYRSVTQPYVPRGAGGPGRGAEYTALARYPLVGGATARETRRDARSGGGGKRRRPARTGDDGAGQTNKTETTSTQEMRDGDGDD